jgi:hypothetical protein
MMMKKGTTVKPNYYDTVKEFVDASYDYYGNYSHAAGFLQSVVSGFMEGYEKPESVARLLKERTDEMRVQTIRNAA